MMRFLILFLFLFNPFAANAEWVKLGIMSERTITYVDPSTKRKSGHLVKLWLLYDHPEPQIVGANRITFRSTKFQMQFDCQNEMNRSLYFSAHVGQMGGGEVAYTENQPNNMWKPVAPGSMTEEIFKFACKGR